MHTEAHKVKGVLFAAHVPTDEGLRETLGDLKRYAPVRLIAAALGLSYRTLYRHLGDDPPALDIATRAALEDLFDGTGLLSGVYDRETLRAAATEVRRLASTSSAEGAESAHARASRARRGGKKGRAG